MPIKSLAEAEAALLPYVPLVAQLTGQQTTLDRIVPLMQLLGNPQEQIRAVHIAGTSGKTSTAYYMAALLKAGGAKVGLTVSPHVDSIAERVQIDGQALSEAEFCAELETFLKLVEQAPQAPSYFELLYAFAIWVFAQRGVDYAVIETGMGGLYDATNIIQRPDKVCVLTDIGFDHMHVLGNTLAEIAAQKIGIVQSGNVAFCFEQKPEVMQVYKSWIAEHEAELRVTTQADQANGLAKELLLLPAYQQRNWLLAYWVYRSLAERDDLPALDTDALQTTRRTVIPGRMDVRQVQGKTIVMDGAHNGQKMQAFVSSFQEWYPDTKPVVMLALKKGKEYQQVVPLLAELTDHIILTTFNTSQDLPAQSMDPEELAAACREAGVGHVEVVTNNIEALRALLAVPETIGIITGSFYMLSQIRNNELLA